jgi:integrase
MATVAMQPELLDRYIAAKMAEGLAPKTIGNHISTLSKMFEVAMRWRIVGSNPVARIDRPKVDTPETQVLTEVEVARLIGAYRELESAAADGDRAWWELARRLTTVALGTALRRGELLGLRWQDVQLLEGRLHVRQAFVMGAMMTPESRASRRTVSFSPVTQAALQEQWSGTRYRGDSDLVFGHPLLGKPLDPSKISRSTCGRRSSAQRSRSRSASGMTYATLR